MSRKWFYTLKIGKTILFSKLVTIWWFSSNSLGEDLKEGPKKRKDYKEDFWYKSKKAKELLFLFRGCS